MWTNNELKTKARGVLKRNYWQGVAVHLIFFLVISAVEYLLSRSAEFYVARTANGRHAMVLYYLFLLFELILVLMPLNVGICAFFMRSRNDMPRIGNLTYAFRDKRYLKVVGAMAWQMLFFFLWFIVTDLLLRAASFPLYRALHPSAQSLIVGKIPFIAAAALSIFKYLGYRFVPYILADHHAIGYKRALKLSIAMTAGQKKRILSLYLSFFGWVLLAVVPIGLAVALFSVYVVRPLLPLLMLGFVFLRPYMDAVFSELYVTLRENALNNGLCIRGELNLPDIEIEE
jgi:uncharacterized membrane protein